jgi:aldehyde:ferredoxin oxidoreductase
LTWTGQFYNAVTGASFTEQDVQRAGERIINLARAYNLREGLTPADDALPERILKEPLADGIGKGEVVNLEYMLDRYYKLRQWDRSNGMPSKEKLLELGLVDIVKDLKL